MPAAAHAVFAISVDGAPRKLLTVQERGSGDLTIINKHGVHATPTATYATDETYEITNDKYSVHLSPHLPSHSVIKHTYLIKNGIETFRRNYTSALKVTNRLVPIFSERCRDLSPDRYKFTLKSRERIITLGEYSPALFQLYFQVFACRQDRPFHLFSAHDISMARADFGVLSIIILYSFFTCNSESTGHRFSVTTYNDDDDTLTQDPILQEFQRHLQVGVDEIEAALLFSSSRQHAVDVYCDTTEADLPPDQRAIMKEIRALSSTFFARGMADTREWFQWRNRFELYHLFNS